MRKLRIGALITGMLLCVAALGQSPPPTPITTKQITFPVFQGSPSKATNATLAVVGNPGPTTSYYWISANYLVGKAPLAGPFLITSAPNVLSGSNYVTVNPTFADNAVLTYDTLRTSTSVAPSGACACAVASGAAVGTVTNDQSASLNAYTVNAFNMDLLTTTIDSEVQSAGVAHLILRQNGVFIADLNVISGGGSVTGTGTANIIPLWNSGTALINSVLVQSGATTPGSAYTFASSPGSQSITGDGSGGADTFTLAPGTPSATGGTLVLESTAGAASGGSGNVIIQVATPLGGAGSAGSGSIILEDSNASPNSGLQIRTSTATGFGYVRLGTGTGNGANFFAGNNTPSFNCSSPNVAPAIYYKTNPASANDVEFVCFSGTTWTALGTGSGNGTVTGTGVVNSVPFWSTSTNLISDAGFSYLSGATVTGCLTSTCDVLQIGISATGPFGYLNICGSACIAIIAGGSGSGGGAIKVPLSGAGGTFAVSVSSPLVLNTTTGNLTCPTCGTGAGTVTTTGSPVSPELAGFSAATSITNVNLSGDVTTTNTLATTLAAIQGTTVTLTSPAVGQTLSFGAGPALVNGYPGITVDTQSGASYTVKGDGAGSDRAALLNTTNNTTSTAVTVPLSGSAGFGSFFPFVHCNGGTVIATDTASVNSNATLVLQAKPAGGNPECALFYGTNAAWLAAEILPTDANGQLAPAGTPPAIVQTGKTNVFGAFLQDFSASTMKIPQSAGFVTNVNSTIGIDTTTGITHQWGPGGTDTFNVATSATSSSAVQALFATTTPGLYTVRPIAGTDLPAVAVQTGQTNVYGGFLQDFTSGTMEIPEAAGFTTNVNSTIGLDTTANIVHLWTNGADSLAAATTATSTTTTQALFATATAGLYGARAIALGDLPTPTFPITVVSGVSGGIPCFTATTTEASSAILNLNKLTKGGGAGVCPTNSSIGDDGTTVTTSEAVSIGAAANMTISASGLITKSNNIATAGQGFPLIVGITSQKNETTTADANVLTFAPPAAVGDYRVCVVVSVSAATAGIISWTLSWTDSNGTAQSNIAQNLVQIQPATVPAPAQSFTTSAAGNYSGCTSIDINNGSASIIVKWVGGGTTTAKMSATIERLI